MDRNEGGGGGKASGWLALKRCKNGTKTQPPSVCQRSLTEKAPIGDRRVKCVPFRKVARINEKIFFNELHCSTKDAFFSLTVD